jgi:hypothetical protein
MPEWDEIYKRIVPGLWPKRYAKSGGQISADLETYGHALSWVREAFDWILHAFFPDLDANALFLDRWEAAFGLEAAGTVAKRQAAVIAAMRQRHTMTEDQIRAIFCQCFSGHDPAEIHFVWPSGADVETYATSDEAHVKHQNFMLIWNDAGLDNLVMADALIRRLCPAWQRWSISEQRSMRYGNGVNTSLVYRWGRSAIGNG